MLLMTKFEGLVVQLNRILERNFPLGDFLFPMSALPIESVHFRFPRSAVFVPV